MVFKINISDKSGKTYKLEIESEFLDGKGLGSKIPGKEILSGLEGYELEITGASDRSGFTAIKDVEGIGLKKVLLSYGKAMKKRPKREGKKKHSKNRPKGLKLRKSVRGKVISPSIVQINMKITKPGSKPLSEVFPDQNKSEESEKPIEKKEEAKTTEKPVEKPKE
jgi:small subunit ribosomal protein S6e